MNKALLLVMGIVAVFCSCKNISPFPIDEQPTIAIDTHLLGVWQADKSVFNDYFLVQNYDDFYQNIPEQYKDDSSMLAEKKYKDYLYYITEVDTGKAEFNLIAYLSEINHTRLVNFGFYSTLQHRHIKHGPKNDKGFWFAKMSVNESKNKIELIPDNDTLMLHLKNSAEVRKRVTKLLNNKLYFDRVGVFTKISSDHRHKRKY